MRSVTDGARAGPPRPHPGLPEPQQRHDHAHLVRRSGRQRRATLTAGAATGLNGALHTSVFTAGLRVGTATVTAVLGR